MRRLLILLGVPLLMAVAVSAAHATPITCTPPPDIALASGGSAAIEASTCTTSPKDQLMSMTVTHQPRHGTLQQRPGPDPSGQWWTYVPDPGFRGPDSLSYTMWLVPRGSADSTEVTQRLVVGDPSGTNEPPRCQPPARVSVRAGDVRALHLACSDVDGDPLTIVVDGPPTRGTLSAFAPAASGGWDATYSVTDPGGDDTISVHADDGHVAGPSTSLHIATIPAGVNNAPFCTSLSDLWVEAGTTVRSPATACGDADGDPLTLSVVDPPAHGTVTFDGPVVIYHADAGAIGGDHFTYRASDGHATTVPMDADVLYSPSIGDGASCWWEHTLDGPWAVAGKDYRLSVGCGGVPTDAWTFGIDTPPQHGTLTAAPGDTSPFQQIYTYRAAPAFRGLDQLVVHGATGGTAAWVTASVKVVGPTDNLPPSCTIRDAALQVHARETLLGRLDCNQVQASDHLSGLVVEPPAHGRVTVDPSSLEVRYRPDPDYDGPDSVTLAVDDGRGATGMPNRLDLMDFRADYNRPPVCDNPDGVFSAGVHRYGRCRDLEGDAFDLAVVQAPMHGAFAVHPAGWWTDLDGHDRYDLTPGWTYQLPDTYLGEDSVTFSATDQLGASRTYTSTQRIFDPPSPPPIGGSGGSGGSGSAPEQASVPAEPVPTPAAAPVTPAPAAQAPSVAPPAAAPIRSRTIRVTTASPALTTVSCPARCSVLVTTIYRLARSAHAAGSQRMTLPDGALRMVTLRVPASVRHALRRGRQASVRVTVSVRSGAQSVTRRARLTLRR